MTRPHIRPAYAKIDPAHLFDGLFVPTNGKARGRILVEPRRFGHLDIGFQGFEQPGSDDQSILLALTAQLGIDGLVIDANPTGPISQKLRLALDFEKPDTAPIASKRTTLRSLLIDAGYKDFESGRALNSAKDSLNRLSNVQIREVNHNTGWDRRCNLVSVSFNHKTEEIYVAANPRLTAAVFRGQHVKISLFERNALETEVAKILHCWLCSNIRLGRSLGDGNGAHLDTLAPHVWGRGAGAESKQVQSKRRGLLRAALDEISERTRRLEQGNGWAIDQAGSGLVCVSRPKALPFLEGKLEMSPSEYHDCMTQVDDASNDAEEQPAEWANFRPEP